MDVTDITSLFDKFISILGKGYFPPLVFLIFVGILLLAFILRYIIWYKQANSLPKKRLKELRMFILGHVMIELLVSFILGYIIIKSTGMNKDNYTVNYIIAPALGILISIYIDNKLFMDDKSNYQVKKETDNKDNNTVTVNINGVPTEDNTSKKNVGFLKNSMPIPNDLHSNIENRLNEINRDISDGDTTIDDHTSGLISIIHDINQSQHQLSEEVDHIKTEVNTIGVTIDAMRETMMTDKKFKLKKHIYECLNQGFATPSQNEVIVSDYNNYIAMKGNGEIKDLYNNHYIKLDIHEDRRVQDIPVKKDRRRN